ncbi:MAG: Bro-N domain-containing protein [Zoogloeaceae bacterium]|jgi:prophage antirepressor-like protein|nr:Bro-N domain-containing protein [Zoogloeaceae bacterium]
MSQSQGASAPTIFNFQSHDVRVATRDGEPWFVAADVCAALNLKNVAMALRHLDDDEKGISNVDTLGGKQNLLAISESGLYALVLRSRKPEARKFAKWVTSEVLPAIRKTGRYSDRLNRLNTPEETGESIILKLHSMQAGAMPKEMKKKIVKLVQTRWPGLCGEKIHDAGRAKAAAAIALEASKAVAQSVLEAFIEGEEPGSLDRYLLSLSWDARKKTFSRVHVSAIERDAYVASIPRLAEMIAEPGCATGSEELATLAQACVKELQARLHSCRVITRSLKAKLALAEKTTPNQPEIKME